MIRVGEHLVIKKIFFIGDLKVLAVAHPSEEVYKGTDVTLYCCVNIDPANHIDANGVRIQFQSKK